VFWVKNGIIYTPPLSEGGIAGVARRFLMEALPAAGFRVEEALLSVAELESADEIFLTNAVRGVRYVEKFKNRKLTSPISRSVQQLWKEKLS
jgi:branched-chain amino acid aminotransferase